MAITQTYYLDAPTLMAATTVFSNIELTEFSADGWYSDGEISRRQLNHSLLPYESCSSPSTNLYITDLVSDPDTGITTYKLHVENSDFIGYANVVGRRADVNAKLCYTRVSPFGNDLTIPNTTPVNQSLFNSTVVAIPIGVYDCTIQATGEEIDEGEGLAVDGGISYGYTTDYYTYLDHAEAHYIVNPTTPPAL